MAKSNKSSPKRPRRELQWSPALGAWGDRTLEVLDQLVDASAREPNKDPRRAKQMPPEGDWTIWLLRPGRGFGKTFAGAMWILDRVAHQGARQIALVSSTASDVRDTLILNRRSGIIHLAELYYPHLIPEYIRSEAKLKFPNGAEAKIFSAEKPERARGPEHDTCWLDEIDSFGAINSPRKANDLLDNLLFGLRVGKDPRMMCTSTPKPGRMVQRLIKRGEDHGDVVVTSGTTYENRKNLAPGFMKEIVRRHEGTRLGRQEIHGEVLTDVIGGLFSREIIDKFRVAPESCPVLIRRVVAVDPSASATGDETGIVGGGMAENGHVYVTIDSSLQASPDTWGRVVAETAELLDADRVAVETNMGGDMVGTVLKAHAPNLPLKTIHARRGKSVRAEPVAAMMEQGRVHLVGNYLELEDQLCMMTVGGYEGLGSPDRLDAFVYLVTELAAERGWYFSRERLDAALVSDLDAWGAAS